MGMINYIAHKAATVRKLFYYRVTLNVLRLKESLLKKISRPSAHYDVVLIDDLMPVISSGFRTFEFSYILKHIPGSALYSIMATRFNKKKHFDYFYIKNIDQFEAGKQQFCSAQAIDTHKVWPFFPWTKIRTKLAYVVFLSNADYMLDYFTEHRIRFILELYPGGNFNLQEEGPNFERLKAVLSSPFLEKLIVTQKVSKEFILKHNLCPQEKLAFKYGATLSPAMMDLPEKRIKYGINKKTIDICFTAAKYTPGGIDKGYDIFIDLAHLLLAESDIYRFHIAGGSFDENDQPIGPAYRKHFNFYGFFNSTGLISFYEDKDIFISPSRSNTLAKGAFDGFPTASCSEAGLNGLCMIFSDPMKLNLAYTDREDAIFTENDPKLFAEIIRNLAKDPAELYRIGEKGKVTTQKINRDHGSFRVSLINECLANIPAS